VPTKVTLCPDLGGWLPLFVGDIGPTRAEDWPTLSSNTIARLEAYNDWCIFPTRNPWTRWREARFWDREIPRMVAAVQADLGDEYIVGE
jgi:hypothetical protein